MCWHHVIKREKLHRVSCLGKTDCNLASRISCSLHRAAIPSFIYSPSPSLATWWWFTDNQSVGLFCVFLNTSARVDQIKSNPPPQVLTCLRKPAANREEELRGLTSVIIPVAGREKTLLDVLAKRWANAERRRLPSTGNQLWSWLGRLFLKLPKQTKIQGLTESIPWLLKEHSGEE